MPAIRPAATPSATAVFEKNLSTDTVLVEGDRLPDDHSMSGVKGTVRIAPSCHMGCSGGAGQAAAKTASYTPDAVCVCRARLEPWACAAGHGDRRHCVLPRRPNRPRAHDEDPTGVHDVAAKRDSPRGAAPDASTH